MDPRITLTQLRSNVGDELAIPTGGVTCIVGANNVGKSQLLRDVIALLHNGEDERVAIVLEAIDFEMTDSSDDEIQSWLEVHGVRQPQGATQPVAYMPYMAGGAAVTPTTFSSHWRHGSRSALRAIAHFFYWYADAQSRVGLAAGGGGMPSMLASASPIGRMYRDGRLEQQLSDVAYKAFRRPLALDRINGNLALRVGKVDVPVPKLDSPTVEYADALAALPLVEEQGDGFKSFIGIALHVLAGEQPIVLIDEPEAFLHPGQCRALGRWLAERARDTNRQILIATHDRDIILGLLQASEAVTVARLTREASASRLRQLSARDLQALWADPVLRYSNVLQGLFHEVVAVCEADADCRFYSAAVDATRTPGAASSDDVLFVPAGGKERIAKMARALAHIGVRVFALADFDVLKHEATIAEIVGAVGGDWSRCVQPYRRMTAALGGADSARWEAAKATGLAAVPRGEPSADATALLEALRTERVLVVPVGEMEGFDRTLGNKGGAWVTSALERRVHESSEEVADFVGALT